MPPDAVKIDRSTAWGNHFRVVRSGQLAQAAPGKPWAVKSPTGVWFAETRLEAQTLAVAFFRHWINRPENATARARAALRFRTARPACWCALDEPCHGDVYRELGALVPPVQFSGL